MDRVEVYDSSDESGIHVTSEPADPTPTAKVSTKKNLFFSFFFTKQMDKHFQVISLNAAIEFLFRQSTGN